MRLIELLKSHWTQVVGWLFAPGGAWLIPSAAGWLPIADPRQVTLGWLFTVVLSAFMVLIASSFVQSWKLRSAARRRTFAGVMLFFCLVGSVVSPLVFLAAEDHWKSAPKMPYYFYLFVVPLTWSAFFSFVAAFATVGLLLAKDLVTGRGGID